MKYMFYGLLLLFFDFNLNLGAITINVLPEFAGYALIAYGMTQMTDCGTWQDSLTLVKGAVAADVVMWLLGVVGFQSNWLIGVLCSVVGTVLELMVTWKIVLGVQELELLHQMDLNGEGLVKAWIGVLVCTVCACLTGILGLVVLWLLFLVAGLVASIMYLVLFYRAKEWLVL